jgi:hypothetical protein
MRLERSPFISATTHLTLTEERVGVIRMDEQTARRDIVRVGRLMYERSYVVSSDGNVSVRLDDGRIVATPTMTCTC